MTFARGWNSVLHLLSFALFLMFTTACSDGGNEGDCSMRLGFEGRVFVPNSDLVAPPSSPTVPIGTANLQGCSEDGPDSYGSAEVAQFEDIPASKVIVVLQGSSAGVYEVEGSRSKDWQDLLDN